MTDISVAPYAPLRDVMRVWMDIALAQARLALDAGEAPIGCVVLNSAGDVMGVGYNTLLKSGNPTLHAEMNAFAAGAGQFAAAKDLVMVSTLEPCVMCTGAAMQAGVTTIVYALKAPADSGTGRVSPPTSPGATNPSVIGNIGTLESRALFVEWIERHEGDPSRDDQRAFIEQLLTLTAGDAVERAADETNA
ncbi:MAG: nucleoside deaminase [Gemmatimonadaceae bacterium]|nr:nucleoside deaminase [Gemmatimonadaceae bacterium]